MKEIVRRCVEALRIRHAQGDSTSETECIDRFGASIHRRVRHMARTGKFVGELGEFAERALRHIDGASDGSRQDTIREASRLACLAMVGNNVSAEWDTLRRPSDATVVCV